MVDIDSPILRKKKPSLPQAIKTFTVDDRPAPSPNSKMNPLEQARIALSYINGGSPNPAPTQHQEFDNEEEDAYKLEEQIRLSKLARQGKDRLSAERVKRIEFLAGFGSLTKDVDIDGVKFTLRTLKSKEFKHLFKFGRELASDIINQFEMQLAIRNETLLFAIKSVNDEAFEDVLGASSLEDLRDKIENIQEDILTLLYAEYEKLVDESKKKYALKSDEDVKEVLEDLKK